MLRILGLMAGLLIIVATAAGQSIRVTFSARHRYDAAPVSLDSVRIENLFRMQDTVITDPFIIDLEISTGVQDRMPGLVRSLEISGNFANPFTDATSFTVTTATCGSVQLELFSITGRREANLNAELEAGMHQFSLKAASLPAGVYLLTASAGQTSRSVRIVKSGAAGEGSAAILHTGRSAGSGSGEFLKAAADLYRFTGYADTHYPESIEAVPMGDTAVVFDMRRIEIAPVTMALIQAGTFRMGDITGTGDIFEKPVHEVTITRPFLLGRTEVTQAQWMAVMGSNPSDFKGADRPVETVSWYDAVEFCNQLSKQEGFDTCYSGSGTSIVCDFTVDGYRLPTEAEWEYACRGGTETDFYTGNMTYRGISPLDPALDRAGWYGGNMGSPSHHPVAQKEPNAFGLYDMHGNVYEWCWDWYSSSFYSSSPAADPRGPASGLYRVLRGGSWSNEANWCRSAKRIYNNLGGRNIYYGFRVARNS